MQASVVQQIEAAQKAPTERLNCKWATTDLGADHVYEKSMLATSALYLLSQFVPR